MVDVRNQDNSIKIEVMTPLASNNLSVGNHSSEYYNSLAKSWANKLDGSVDGIEFSSKYYAQLSKEYSEISNSAKDSILENSGFQIVVEDLIGSNSIKLCAENMNSIQNAAFNAQTAAEKAALSIEQAEIATQKAQEVYDILENSANVDLANITDAAKSVIRQYGGTWGFIQGNMEEQTDLAEKFSNKLNLDMSNCTKPYIVETYLNGTSGYVTYSDDGINGKLHLEWGYSNGGASDITVQFLKEYKDTNYNISTGTKSNSTSVAVRQTVVKNIYTNSFTVQTVRIHSSGTVQSDEQHFWWKSLGYIN